MSHDLTAAHIIAPGAGEIIGDAPDRRVEILCEHEALHVTWTRFGPGRDGADLHIHHTHTDLFYVLEGELTVRLGPDGDETVAPAGTLSRVPPLVVHGFRNGSDAELRYLNLHAPGRGFADYMRAMRDGEPVDFDQWPPPDDGGRPVSEVRLGPIDEDVLLDAITISEAEVGEPIELEPGQLWLFVLGGSLALASGQVAVTGSWVDLPPEAARGAEPAGDGPARLLKLVLRAG